MPTAGSRKPWQSGPLSENNKARGECSSQRNQLASPPRTFAYRKKRRKKLKTRTLSVVLMLLAVVFIAATGYAAPSCCDPKNGSTTGATLAPGPQARGPVLAPLPQQRVAAPQAIPAMNRGTGSIWAGQIPQTRYAAARPVGLSNAPAVPSCCALPNNSGPAGGITPPAQPQFRGCGCCGGAAGRAPYSALQPRPGTSQSALTLPNASQQVTPVGQASCCQPAGSNIRAGRSSAQFQGFAERW